jgi:hypothetical protein
MAFLPGASVSDMAGQHEFVIYNGARMVSYWPERIEQAQQEPTYRIGGRDLPRVRYGQERIDWGAERQPCHDCRVQAGQLHVPSCDVEECPNCGEQAITCDCGEEDDEGDAGGSV